MEGEWREKDEGDVEGMKGLNGDVNGSGVRKEEDSVERKENMKSKEER